MPYETQNLELIANETAVLELQFWGEDDAPYPVGEWEIISQIWSLDGLEKLADWQITVLNPLSALVELRLDSDVTRHLPDRCVWDLLTIDANGDQRYWVGGEIRVKPGHSRKDG